MDTNGNYIRPEENSIITLTVHEDEEIQIGEDVAVWWRRVPNGGRAKRIYISAPRTTKVHRIGKWDKRGESV